MHVIKYILYPVHIFLHLCTYIYILNISKVGASNMAEWIALSDSRKQI